jgi:hypothetical protein
MAKLRTGVRAGDKGVEGERGDKGLLTLLRLGYAGRGGVVLGEGRMGRQRKQRRNKAQRHVVPHKPHGSAAVQFTKVQENGDSARPQQAAPSPPFNNVQHELEEQPSRHLFPMRCQPRQHNHDFQCHVHFMHMVRRGMQSDPKIQSRGART